MPALEETIPQKIPSQGLVLIYFWAPWNNLSQVECLFIDELAQHHRDKVKIMWFNIDERPDLAAKYNVHTVPTLLLLEDNRVVEEFVGLAYRHQIRQAIARAANR
ncbi:MAG: thioredoxin [Candidatus Latescibacteria bacterium]|nr:thioredoxin [Candidatus Latescibacterota bacterium]